MSAPAPGLGLAGWLLHLPGLCLRHRRRPRADIVGWNLLALGLTAGLMSAGWLLAGPSCGGLALVLAWLVGHLGWGCFLASRLHQGRVFAGRSVGRRRGEATPPPRSASAG